MKIVSFNVNGLRAVLQKGFLTWLAEVNADFICLQEVKYDSPHLLNDLFTGLGYVHNDWYPAQKKGYSGVAILSRHPALRVSRGSGVEHYDAEGRILCFETEQFILINVYAPSGTTGEIRQAFKMEWLAHFQEYVNNICYSIKIPLIICGDFNIAHQEMDIHNPKSSTRSSGFLPEERQWVSQFLASGFVDAFRFANPAVQQYSWWTYRANARSKNLGWRIDYHFVSESIKEKITRAELFKEVCFSDHCPIMLEIKV